ncbi:hypothetical protein BH23PAT2_BH23PAT2_09880 [soil metagenome]
MKKLDPIPKTPVEDTGLVLSSSDDAGDQVPPFTELPSGTETLPPPDEPSGKVNPQPSQPLGGGTISNQVPAYTEPMIGQEPLPAPPDHIGDQTDPNHTQLATQIPPKNTGTGTDSSSDAEINPAPTFLSKTREWITENKVVAFTLIGAVATATLFGMSRSGDKADPQANTTNTTELIVDGELKQRTIVEDFNNDTPNSQIAPGESGDYADPEEETIEGFDLRKLPDHFTDASLEAEQVIYRKIRNGQSESIEDVPPEDQTFVFWRGTVVVYEDRENLEPVIVRFDNPIIAEVDGRLFWTGYSQELGRLVTYDIGKHRPGNVEEGTFLFQDGYFNSSTSSVDGDPWSGQFVQFAPRSFNTSGLKGFDTMADLLRDEEGTVYATAYVTSSADEAYANIDRTLSFSVAGHRDPMYRDKRQAVEIYKERMQAVADSEAE